jgi:hypothetical protein
MAAATGTGIVSTGFHSKKGNPLIEVTPTEPMPALLPYAAQNNMMLSRTEAALAIPVPGEDADGMQLAGAAAPLSLIFLYTEL